MSKVFKVLDTAKTVMSEEQYNLVHLAHRFIYLFSPSQPLSTADLGLTATEVYPLDKRLRTHAKTKVCLQLLFHLMRAGVSIRKTACRTHGKNAYKLRLREPARSAREKIDTFLGYPSVDSVNLIRRVYAEACARQNGRTMDFVPRCMHGPSPFHGLRDELIARTILHDATGYSHLYVQGHTALLHDLLEGRLDDPELHLAPLAKRLYGGLLEMVRAVDHSKLSPLLKKKGTASALSSRGYSRLA